MLIRLLLLMVAKISVSMIDFHAKTPLARLTMPASPPRPSPPEPVLWINAEPLTPIGMVETMSLELSKALRSEKLDALKLIKIAKAHPKLKSLFEALARVFEGHTIEEHTYMVLNQFSRYVEPGLESKYFSVADFRLLLLLHDIGKSIPESKKDQVRDTKKVIAEVRNFLPISDTSLCILNELLSCDVLGPLAVKSQKLRATIEDKKAAAYKVLAGEDRIHHAKRIAAIAVYADDVELAQLVEDTAVQIQRHAAAATIPVEDFYSLLQAYYKSDTLAYTIDAIDWRGYRGYPSLEYLFSWNDEITLTTAEDKLFIVDPGLRQIKFSSGIERVFSLANKRLK
jgi:hypothetical protein